MKAEGCQHPRKGWGGEPPECSPRRPPLLILSSPLNKQTRRALLAAPAPPVIITTTPGACLTTATRTPYTACADLGPGVRLYWNWTAGEAASLPGARRLFAAAAPTPTPTMVGTLESDDPAGWASWGWPSVPGKMKGGRVLVLQACPACPTGASLGPFSLTGYTSASVQADPQALALGGAGPPGAPPTAARLLPGGAGLAADFTLTPPPLPAASTTNPAAAVPFIAARGRLKPDGRLAMHGWDGHGDLDLSAGRATGAAPTSPATLAGGAAAALSPAAKAARRARNRRLLLAHAVCMVLAWCVLVPAAIGLSAAARDGAGRWFKGHWALNAVALALTVAGLGLGRAHPAAHKPRILPHSVVGYVVVAATLALAAAGAFRPARHSRGRSAWGALHRGGGLLTAALAFANTMAGFWLMRTPVLWPIVSGCLWGALVLGFGGKAVANRLAGKPVGGGVLPGESPLPSVWDGGKGGGGDVQMLRTGGEGGRARPDHALSAAAVKGSMA